MNLRDLKYLVALADHRHFGRAAEASFVSQPTLSTQIKKLEEELGVVLIERGPRKLMLTEVGEAIAERARDVLNEVEQIREEARRHRDPEAGSFRLGLFPTIGPYLLPHVMPNLRARFPQMELYLIEEKTEVLLDQLRRGHIDAAVLALPLEEKSFEQELLFEEPFVLCAPADQPAPKHLPVQLFDLQANSLLLLEEGHCMRDQALEVCERAGARERQGFRATSLETLRQMVAAGVGVTLLPVLSVQPPVASNPALRIVAFEEPSPKRSLGLIWRRQSARANLMPMLAEVLRSLPEGLLSTESFNSE